MVNQSFAGASEMRGIYRIKTNQSSEQADVCPCQLLPKEEHLIRKAVIQTRHCFKDAIYSLIILILALGFACAIDSI